MVMVSQQAGRQAARREAMNALTQRRRERVERDKRIDALVVAVMLALAERDAAVAAFELRAGTALRRITDEEGLPLHDVVERCGERLTTREATRLRRLAEHHHETGGSAVAAPEEVEGDDEAGLTADVAAGAVITPTVEPR